MFATFAEADLIAINCLDVDRVCREELRAGIIVSERDYVSTLSTRIRDRMRVHGYGCFAQTLRQGIETENGVDGIILFQVGSEIKAGWYEAKWPRTTQLDYHWDSLHPERRVSHFTEQLIKQQSWTDSIALWEMFFNEGADGFASPPYETYGSSCVWYEHAYEFMRSEGIINERWTTAKLKELLEKFGINFYSIIYSILSCRKGKKTTLLAGERTVTFENNDATENVDRIPLPTNISDEFSQEIQTFMEKRNIAGYVYIETNIQPPKK